MHFPARSMKLHTHQSRVKLIGGHGSESLSSLTEDFDWLQMGKKMSG